MKRRRFRRVAYVIGLFGLFEAGDAIIGALSARHPNSGLATFVGLKKGNG